MQSAKQAWKSFCAKYVHFVEHQGFMVILALCIGVIAGTAAWTNQASGPVPMPTSPADDAASAAGLYQQSLAEAATPTPSPTEAPPSWQAPLDSISLLRAFHGARLVQSGVTGLWQLHDAVDLRCTAGEIIRAMADGVVTEAEEDGHLGAWVTIDHGQGVEIQYAGMAMGAGLRAGDPVSAGQTVGFAGNAMLDETDLGAHLHLRATRDGQAFDPLTLLPE